MKTLRNLLLGLIFTIAVLGIKNTARAEDTTWQEDFDYDLYRGEIRLKEYIGSKYDIEVPSSATINGETYHTVLCGRRDSSKALPFYLGVFYPRNDITSVVIDSGVSTDENGLVRLFSDCKSLKSVDLTGLDSSLATSMDSMFEDCSHLSSVDLRGLNTSNVTKMNSMFSSCANIQKIDLSGLDISNVKFTDYMFRSCQNVTEINFSGWNTENLASTQYMFLYCGSLVNIDLSMFDTYNLKNITAMFSGCRKITYLDLGNFDCSAVNKADGFLDSTDSLSVLEAPINLNQTVILNKTMYASDGQAYTVLPRGLSESITLKTDWSNSEDLPEQNPDPSSMTREQKVEAFVRRMYTCLLARDAEDEGVKFWSDLILYKNTPAAECAKFFVLGSQEFLDANLNNDVFLDRLYATFFGEGRTRANDADGFAFWTDVLERGYNRKWVLAGFVNSDEFTNICIQYSITRGQISLTPEDAQTSDLNLYVDEEKVTAYVDRLYNTILNRPSEADGKVFWVGLISRHEMTAQRVAVEGFFFSDEYLKKNTTNTEFVNTLYLSLLNRNPADDPDGFAFWVSALDNGMDRMTVIEQGFGDSPEFRGILQSYGLLRK